MAQILMMQGLPASGKSTYAKDLVKNGEGKWKRINKDSLRLMLDEGKWSHQREKGVVHARNAMVETLLINDINVIIDDTNFAPLHEQTLRIIATNLSAEFHVKLIDTDLETCLKRNRLRPQLEQVPDRVILNMYDKYVPKPSWQSGPDDCIIVDVDGTVADMTGVRGPYNQDKCNLDKPIWPIIDTVCALANAGNLIMFLSGREGTKEVTAKTVDWLLKHFPSISDGGLPYDIALRAEGDKRADWIVKQELFMKHVAGIYNPLLVIDDRPQVCRMWRYTLGLTVLQVNDMEF